jgi:release factor glutamine methyltransferase
VSDSRTLLAAAARRLAGAGVDSPRLDARLLWEHAQKPDPPLEGGSKLAEQGGANFGEGSAVIGTSAYPSPNDFVSLNRSISGDHRPVGRRLNALSPQGEGRILERFNFFLSRRLAREPLAYITGHKEFWSLDLEVGPGVLIPRPETETVIEEALRRLPDRTAPLKVLDIGTGSGCLLAAFLKEFPNARGLGIDISPQALAVSARNLARAGLAERAEIRPGDMGEGLGGRFDVILSNPPYIRTADLATLAPELRYEPVEALDGGPDGLAAIRRLAKAMARLPGLGLVEIGAGQGDEARAIYLNCGLEALGIARDLAGVPRVLVTRGGSESPGENY